MASTSRNKTTNKKVVVGTIKTTRKLERILGVLLIVLTLLFIGAYGFSKWKSSELQAQAGAHKIIDVTDVLGIKGDRFIVGVCQFTGPADVRHIKVIGLRKDSDTLYSRALYLKTAHQNTTLEEYTRVNWIEYGKERGLVLDAPIRINGHYTVKARAYNDKLGRWVTLKSESVAMAYTPWC